MAGQTIDHMFTTYTDAVRKINDIKLEIMGGRPLHVPRPQLTTYLPNDVNRLWEMIDDIEEHLGRYRFNRTSHHMDFVKAMRWYYEGGRKSFELKLKDTLDPIAIHVPGTREEISRIKNDTRMTFVVLTKRKRVIEGIGMWSDDQNYRRELIKNSQEGSKAELEFYERDMRTRDAKDLGTLYLTLLRGLNALIHSIVSVRDPYKSAWNLEALNIRGQLEDLRIILSGKLTDLHKLCERCGIEKEGSEELKEFKQTISKTFIRVLIHIDYFLIETSDPPMYKDTITNYIRERKSLNYVSEMQGLYAEESQSYYTAWKPQFSRRMDAIITGTRVLTALLHDGKSMLGIS